MGCELLTNFVSLHVWNNTAARRCLCARVVNCWQILYLCTSETIWNHPTFCNHSCELLTNFVSLHVWNNYWRRPYRTRGVVNCWQILYLCTSETIDLPWQQLDAGCELLTNFVSLHVWNNAPYSRPFGYPVVNCWQILYLCTSETIAQAQAHHYDKLWIADKFCIFARLKQCRAAGINYGYSCELLTNFVSLHVWNNDGSAFPSTI